MKMYALIQHFTFLTDLNVTELTGEIIWLATGYCFRH